MKTFTLKNPAKPPAYLRLYTSEGMAICEMEISDFQIEQHVNHSKNVIECFAVFDASEIKNMQPDGNSCLGECEFVSQPGRAISAFSYTMSPETRKSLTVDAKCFDRLKINKATPVAKQPWWRFWK
jgi:hypothetical protein